MSSNKAIVFGNGPFVPYLSIAVGESWMVLFLEETATFTFWRSRNIGKPTMYFDAGEATAHGLDEYADRTDVFRVVARKLPFTDEPRREYLFALRGSLFVAVRRVPDFQTRRAYEFTRAGNSTWGIK